MTPKPRLVYIGDVPVEATYYGSLQLHRLLAEYPPEKLCIVETASTSAPSRRLADVKYLSYPIAKQRWLNTRFHSHAVGWFSRVAARAGSKINAVVDGFDSESVLTVTHGVGWLAAADFAAHRNLPLHLLVHDDWPRVAHVNAAFRAWLEESFARVCSAAKSVFCVSPAMCAAYRKRYGVSAEVLYPIRAIDCAQFEAPPARVDRNVYPQEPFTIAFAGSINSDGYTQALLSLQEAVSSIGGRLLIFGPLTAEEARRYGLNEPQAIVRGLLSAAELMARLRAEADALFVPMSFRLQDRTNMELGFPSKLTDCTAVGLPLLIYGPRYCSAVLWAHENSGVAEVVDTDRSTALAQAVARLAADPSRRRALGQRALEVGRRYFSYRALPAIFDRAIVSAPAARADFEVSHQPGWSTEFMDAAS